MNHHMNYHTIQGNYPCITNCVTLCGWIKEATHNSKSKILPSLVPRPPFNTARGKGYIMYYIHQTLLSCWERD